MREQVTMQLDACRRRRRPAAVAPGAAPDGPGAGSDSSGGSPEAAWRPASPHDHKLGVCDRGPQGGPGVPLAAPGAAPDGPGAALDGPAGRPVAAAPGAVADGPGAALEAARAGGAAKRIRSDGHSSQATRPRLSDLTAAAKVQPGTLRRPPGGLAQQKGGPPQTAPDPRDGGVDLVDGGGSGEAIAGASMAPVTGGGGLADGEDAAEAGAAGEPPEAEKREPLLGHRAGAAEEEAAAAGAGLRRGLGAPAPTAAAPQDPGWAPVSCPQPEINCGARDGERVGESEPLDPPEGRGHAVQGGGPNSAAAAPGCAAGLCPPAPAVAAGQPGRGQAFEAALAPELARAAGAAASARTPRPQRGGRPAEGLAEGAPQPPRKAAKQATKTGLLPGLGAMAERLAGRGEAGQAPAASPPKAAEEKQAAQAPAAADVDRSAARVLPQTTREARALATRSGGPAPAAEGEAAGAPPPSEEFSPSLDPPPPPLHDAAAPGLAGGGGRGRRAGGDEVTADQGHELVVRSPFVVCRKCGAYVSATRGARRLGQACSGPLPPLLDCTPAERGRRSRRERLLDGKHPTSGASLGT